jgi:hypothetical protein
MERFMSLNYTTIPGITNSERINKTNNMKAGRKSMRYENCADGLTRTCFRASSGTRIAKFVRV